MVTLLSCSTKSLQVRAQRTKKVHHTTIQSHVDVFQRDDFHTMGGFATGRGNTEKMQTERAKGCACEYVYRIICRVVW